MRNLFYQSSSRGQSESRAIALRDGENIRWYGSGLGALLFMVLALLVFTPTAQADSTPTCGGHQQQKCEFSAATEKGAPETSRCSKGFFDPRKGGECWSCPANHKRTIFVVDGGTACQQTGSVLGGFSKATYISKAKALGCPSGQIRDLGKCWTCPKDYNRSIHPINGSLACTVKASLTCDEGLSVKSDARCYDPNVDLKRNEAPVCGGLYQLKCEFAHANYVSKSSLLSCPKGGFFDPREGGECWECPAEYNRSIHPVDGHLACTAKASNTCEPGLRPDFGNICQYSKAGEVEAAARLVIGRYTASILETILLAYQIEGSDNIMAYVDAQNDAAASRIVSQDNYAETADAADDDGLKTLTVGVVGSVGVVAIGSTGEHGLAMDISGDGNIVKWYASLDYKLGPALNVDSGANISLWTSQNNGLSGDAHGFVFGVTDAFGAMNAVSAGEDLLSATPGFSCAVTIWFDYDMNFIGFSITPVASIGIDLGGYVRATTVQTN